VAVRKTKSWQNNGFVGDVKSTDIRCNELTPGTGASMTVNVTAGQSVAFQANPDIYHPGPLAFYMAKVPPGKTAATFDGAGAVWFKIFQEQPKFGAQLSWTSNGMFSSREDRHVASSCRPDADMKTHRTGLKQPSVTIPKCIPSGDYLLRIEHLGLHAAGSAGGGQFYIACGQLTVSGGGSTEPGPAVALPGAYAATDPGILININYPVPTSYANPGPALFAC